MTRRTLLSAILSTVCAAGISASGDTFERRAARTFENEDWPSAQAMYGVMSEREPARPDIYARAIISSEMTADTLFATTMLERAMTNGVPLDSVLDNVRRTSTSLGHAELYAGFLHRSQTAMPWLSRAIDARLLDYYMLRHDAPMTALYAERMLAGIPDNIPFMLILARARMASGEPEASESVYRHILEIEPDNYDALVELGSYLYERKPEEARILLGRAAVLRPTPYLQKMLN